MKMKRSGRSGRLLHGRRDVSTTRPIHITNRVAPDVPSLRHPAIQKHFRGLLAEARQRGVRTVVAVVMDNHVHWCVRADSRDALREATKYVFSKLAKFINRLFGRRGKVFVERYYSECARNARQAWNTLGYILRNPFSAGRRGVVGGGWDRYTCIDEEAIGGDGFLRSLLGPSPRERRALLMRMTRGPVPFVPLASRLQPRLPGI